MELSSNARTWHWMYGFHPSFLEKLCPCHSTLICTVSCYSSHGCMSKPCQWFSTFKCRSICFFTAPRLVIPVSSLTNGKIQRSFLLFLVSSLVIPFFGCSGPLPGIFLLYEILKRFLGLGFFLSSTIASAAYQGFRETVGSCLSWESCSLK